MKNQEIKITKHMYSGNGHINNIGYRVTDGNSTIFIPALNNTKTYGEHYNDLVIKEGLSLITEAESFLKNVYTAGASNIIDALKLNNEIQVIEDEQDCSDAQE